MAPRLTGEHVSARDLVLSGNCDGIADAALGSLLLGDLSGRSGTAVIARHPMPDGLWRVGAHDLVGIARVGPAAAARLLCSLELGRRASLRALPDRPFVSRPEDVVALVAPQLRGCDREHFWALALNTKNQLIRTLEVSIGSLNASIVHPRELFKEAVRASAASIVVVHNHPSGDATPSGADIQLTRRLVKAGDVLGIEVLDHVVIGDGGAHASLRDLGLM